VSSERSFIPYVCSVIYVSNTFNTYIQLSLGQKLREIIVSLHPDVTWGLRVELRTETLPIPIPTPLRRVAVKCDLALVLYLNWFT